MQIEILRDLFKALEQTENHLKEIRKPRQHNSAVAKEEHEKSIAIAEKEEVRIDFLIKAVIAYHP